MAHCDRCLEISLLIAYVTKDEKPGACFTNPGFHGWIRTA